MSIKQINRWFTRMGERVIRRRWWVIAAFTALFAAGFYGLQWMNVNDSWDSYFLENDPMRMKTDDWFGGNEGLFGVYKNNSELWIKAKYSF
ncbi:hypothetical protein [Proteiniphilum sp. X52]|uniref:hypothetical protein n=1 Tax=Proteiniphilum sp. X52 TaxID=2382159 RepID=UPI000F0A6D54|nr:hypothetical protein [Proteiniphilum sp. X52]RNC64492.1 hypothetical protein D7D25_11345 [Proteiniphilum sp. X52]